MMQPFRAFSALTCGVLLSLASSLQASPQHAMTLYGEAPKYAEGFSHFAYVNPEAPQGGTLRLGGLGGYDSFNPFINKGVAEENIGLIYETLTYHSPDEPFTEYGLIAERMEKADDSSWVRFYLNPKARFHDGQPITAADVEFTFNTLMEHGAPHYRAYYADVDKVTVEDPLTVYFHFKHSGNRELPLIMGQLPVLPKHWWAERDFNKSNLEIPLGSGPYKIAEYKANRSVRYERVDNWWGRDLAVNRGYYNFNAITADYYLDNTVAVEAFKAGQFDYWLETSAKNWANAYETPALRDGRMIKQEISNHNPTGMQGFVFNLRRERFSDIRVREGLGLLFDFEWANKNLFNGAYSRTQSYFDNSELSSSGLAEGAELAILEPLREQLPASLFSQPFKVAKTDGSGIIREQQRQAYKLFKEAGWKVENDRMLDAHGQPVEIEFLLVQPDFERVLLPYKRNLSDLGIELNIRRVDMSQYINRLRSRDYDMIVSGFGQSNSPGNEQRGYWHSSSADNPGSRNFMGLKNPAIDTLVEQLIQADSRDSLVAHSRALDRALLWGHYVVPNWHIKTWRVAYWQPLQRPAQSPQYDIGLHTWWKAPSSQKASD